MYMRTRRTPVRWIGVASNAITDLDVLAHLDLNTVWIQVTVLVVAVGILN